MFALRSYTALVRLTCGQVPGLVSPWEGLSAVGAWHPKTTPESPIKHQFKAGYLCGFCISWRDAFRGGACPWSLQGQGESTTVQGPNWAHAGSLGIKDNNKQYCTPFFFQQPSEPRLFNEGTQPSNLAQLPFPWGSCPSALSLAGTLFLAVG